MMPIEKQEIQMSTLKRNWNWLGAGLLLFLAACAGTPQSEPSATDFERAQRLDSLLGQLVEEGSVPGVSLLVIEDGKQSYFGITGELDPEADIAMSRNSIGRYYSMTKPIVGVALMTLFEDGKFELDDPIDKYLPEFSNLMVTTNVNEDGSLVLESPKRAVTIRDLMRHTSGMTYGFFTDTPVDKLYRAADLLTYQQTNAEFTQKLTQIPLLAQPGERWIYSVSVDVQGRLIEVLSGQTLGEFLQQTIFDPLAMAHTGFAVKVDDRVNFGPAYSLTDTGLQRIEDDDPKAVLAVNSPFLSKVAFESGGAGLVSTIDDFAQFAKMLANDGALGSVQILTPETLQMMTRDQLGAADHGWLGEHTGFGLDFAVQTGPGGLALPIGSYSWGGLAGTFFWVDPQNTLTAILQIQVIGADKAKVRKRVVAALYGHAADPTGKATE